MAQGLLKIALIKTKNPVKKIKQAATNKIYPAVFLAQVFWLKCQTKTKMNPKHIKNVLIMYMNPLPIKEIIRAKSIATQRQ